MKGISYLVEEGLGIHTLVDSPASEFYVPMFRKTLIHLHEDSDAGESPKRKNTTFRTVRKF